MRRASLALNENIRLSKVAEYSVADGSATAADLNQIALLAKNLFQVPTALVTLVERDRQVFIAKVGIEACETARDISFCSHAIHGTDVLVVPDATLDPRFADNVLVIGPPYVRFYAGAPLVAPGGHVLGTLCIIDAKPRACFSATDRALLAELATLALDKLELNRLESARNGGHARFKAAADASPDRVVCTDETGAITYWNAASARLFGYPAEAAVGQDLLALIAPDVHARDPKLLDFRARGDLLVGRTIELGARRADGHEFPVELSVTERLDEGVISFGYIVRDVTERRASEDRLYRLAHFDALTGLPNRVVLKDRLEALSKAKDAACVLSIDLDGFKDVNDTLGHPAGDALLVSVAQRLESCTRPIDTVARMGGDEFVILLPGIADPVQAAVAADRVIAAVAQDFVFEGHAVNVSASVGFAIHPSYGETSDDLVSNADLALYQAKAEGRHCRRMFVPAMRERAQHRRMQDFELRRAHDRHEFEVYYQPQVRLADGALLGAEALLRWNHPTRGLLTPGAFLPNLDAGPMAAPVGDWVLEQACRQAAIWRRAGAPDFTIGVNLFGAQFRADSLSNRVRGVLASTGLPAQALELEITENIILRHDDEVTAPLRELKDMGVGIAFDDYGTGYASLSMLKTVPLTRLKLDRGFVSGMCQSEGDLAIVHAVLYLGEKFALEVIAEGVETEAQRQILQAEGCTAAQGYLFGHPMPATKFSATFGLVEPQGDATYWQPRRA